MLDNSILYHTNLPVLAALLECGMKECIQKNSETSLVSKITDLIPFFGTSKAERSQECVRATNMLGILKILKNRLHTFKTDPLTEADKTLLITTFSLLQSTKTNLMDFVTPKIIFKTEDDFEVNPAFVNKPWQAKYLRYRTRSLTLKGSPRVLRETIKGSVWTDIVFARIDCAGDKINEEALDVLLNTPWLNMLKARDTFACIWTFHRESMYGIPPEVLNIILKHLDNNLNDLHGKVRQVIIPRNA